MDGLQNLGIDLWSVLVYVVNFGILVGVLTFFLYKPLLGYIEKRQKHIADRIREADRIKSDFEKKLVEMEAQKDALSKELKEELERSKKFIEEKRSELISEMEQERSALINKATEEIERRKNTLVGEVETDLLKLIEKIVLEIVQNKVPASVVEESVQEAWEKYA